MDLRSFIQQHKFHLLALLVLAVYLSPNLVIPGKAVYLVHDNLNSNVVWYKNLAESGKFFAANNEIVPQSLSGLPRGCYPSELNFLHLFYLAFPPLFAYNLNIIIIHLVAFYGMFLLSRRYFLKDIHTGYSWGIALIYAVLPFWPSGGLAITGQPLLLYALLNIYHRDLNWKNWGIIILIPLYSVLIFSNLFFIFILGSVFALYTIIKRKLHFPLILAFVLFVLVSVVAEHKLFEMQFVEHLETHRDLKGGQSNLNFFGVAGISLKHFLWGHYHFYSVSVPLVLILSAWAFVSGKRRERMFVLLALVVAAFISFTYVLPGWSALGNGSAAFFKGVTLRFHSVLPVLWICLLAYSLALIVKKTKERYRVVLVPVLMLMAVVAMFSIGTKDFQGNGFVENSFRKTYFGDRDRESLSFREYYKTDLFSTVRQQLPAGNYRIACLGIEAEIVQYNGYNTIDGYFYYYPKSYNEWFTRICAREMEKAGMRSIGNHCELVSADLKSEKSQVDSLELDFDEMKKVDTKYVFSVLPVRSERLKAVHEFKDQNTRLFVYEIL